MIWYRPSTKVTSYKCNESRNDAEAARYENRKQREQTVIKTAAREQSNDVATHLPRLLTDGNSLE